MAGPVLSQVAGDDGFSGLERVIEDSITPHTVVGFVDRILLELAVNCGNEKTQISFIGLATKSCRGI